MSCLECEILFSRRAAFLIKKRCDYMKKIILLLERFGRVKEHTYEEKKSDFMSRTNKTHKVTVRRVVVIAMAACL